MSDHSVTHWPTPVNSGYVSMTRAGIWTIVLTKPLPRRKTIGPNERLCL